MPILISIKTYFVAKTILLPCDDPEWSNFTLYFCTKL
ncbi:adenine-specific methyltransferase EcoRI family protein [Escherichia coli]